MANSHGTYETTPQRTMAAFDKLPKGVREALANAQEDWASQPILSFIRRQRGWPSDIEKAMIGRIKDWNANAAKEHWYRMHRLAEKGIAYNVAIRRDAVQRKAKGA